MDVSRRDVVAAGALALGASGLQVWQTQDGGWKLLARQGFRLPA